MTRKTHNVAEQFKAFVERIERLDLERVAISESIADVYDEVRAADFNAKAMKALISERRRERRDPAAFRSAAELLEQYRDLLDGTDHALTRAPRARGDQSAAVGAPSPDVLPPAGHHASTVAATAADLQSPSNPNDGGSHDRGAVMLQVAPEVVLLDGVPVTKATSLPPPSVMAMVNRSRPPLTRTSSPEYVQPAPDDGMDLPQSLRRGGRGA